MKLLIKAPRELNELVASLPFMKELGRLFPDDEISLIYDEIHESKIDFFKNDFKTFILPEKNSNLVGVHKYSYNENNLFNIDIFFDLEGSLPSSYLGFCFKAVRRFGFKGGIRSLFYTEKIDKSPVLSLDQNYIKLLTRLTDIGERESNSIPNNNIIEFKRLFQTGVPEDFILVLLDLSDEEEEQRWIHLINSFERQNFLIVEMTNKYNLDEFYLKLNKNNEIVFDKGPTTSKILAHAQKMKAILTNQVWLGWALKWQGAQHVLIIKNSPELKLPLIDERPEHYRHAKSEQDLERVVDSIHIRLGL